MKGQYDRGIGECERTVSLNPNSAENFFRLVCVLNWASKEEKASHIPGM